LKEKKPFPRKIAKASLQLRMKVQQACANADDLIGEIEDVLSLGGKKPDFSQDLHKRLVKETLEEIHSGRINDREFESLIRSLFLSLGASEVRIIPRNLDKGADLIAVFKISNIFKYEIAIQAKRYHSEPPVGKEVIEQLLRGMEAESSDVGFIITSGTFSKEANDYAYWLRDEEGIRIELIDGEVLASLIVEHGLKKQ